MQEGQPDWRYSFSRNDKIPFGSYVLYEIINGFFPNQSIDVSDQSFYAAYDSINYAGSNYIIINREFNPDITDTIELLYYVSIGNSLFISAEQISGIFADSLDLKLSFYINASDTTFLNLSNPDLHAEKPYTFLGRQISSCFSGFDTLNTTILGNGVNGKVNFIKVNFYGGQIYLHTEPLVFTNYNILKSKNMDYYAKVFSYLPLQKTIWDEYYKITKVEARSPLRYILNRKPLKWAYFVGLFSILILFVIGVKRKQRIIPVYEPPVNDSLTFVETIGRLYYQNRDHKNLLNKKIQFFLEYIRSKYFIETDLNSDTFEEKLIAKSGVDAQRVERLINAIKAVNIRQSIHEKDLHKINEQILNFKKETSDFPNTDKGR
ncbi:MAG: hypothetical protein P8X42_05250 [Calditrichaceae bacterium]